MGKDAGVIFDEFKKAWAQHFGISEDQVEAVAYRYGHLLIDHMLIGETALKDRWNSSPDYRAFMLGENGDTSACKCSVGDQTCNRFGPTRG